MIGFVLAGLTVVTLAALLIPLLRVRSVTTGSRTDYAINIYRDQLTELEHEVTRGAMTTEHADATRLEIQRRILASANDNSGLTTPHNSRANLILAAIIALFISAGSLGLYGYLGTPKLPDRPYASRQNDPDMQINAATEIVAAEIEASPSAAGYRRLADMYYASRRFDDAAEAYKKALALDAGDAGTWSLLGESIVMANDGGVVMDAQDAFKTALSHDTSEPRACFYLGLAEAQIGEFKRAVSIWRDLEKNTPPDAPWLSMVRENIVIYSKQGEFNPASVTPAPFH